VFYTFFKSAAREGQPHAALIRGPPGHAQLEKYTNLTMADVVQSSMAFYKDHDNIPVESRKGLKGLDSLYGNTTAINSGGRARGLFTLAVCYSPGGQAISSVNSKKNRNYPCMCTKFPWAHGNAAAESTKHAPSLQNLPRHMAAGSSLHKRGGYDWDQSDATASYNFFRGSGLFQSQDLHSYCTHESTHVTPGNHCKEDKSVTWTWPEGNGYKHLVHPFTKCKCRGHEYVGCEAPHNNGWDENKKCGGGKARLNTGGAVDGGVVDAGHEEDELD
jgi:hypothetical protein